MTEYKIEIPENQYTEYLPAQEFNEALRRCKRLMGEMNATWGFVQGNGDRAEIEKQNGDYDVQPK